MFVSQLASVDLSVEMHRSKGLFLSSVSEGGDDADDPADCESEIDDKAFRSIEGELHFQMVLAMGLLGGGGACSAA